MQKLKIKLNYILIAIATLVFFACGENGGQEKRYDQPEGVEEAVEEKTEQVVEAVADPMQNKGVGPVEEVNLGEIDQTLVAEGQTIFEDNCTACHKVEQRYVGPPLKEVTTRRSPEWIMNMIMNPERMVKEDPIAKALLAEYLSPMANQNITRDQARKLLEYFRSLSEVKTN